MVASVTFGTALILITAFVGIAFAAFQMMLVSKVTIEDSPSRAEGTYFVLFLFCFEFQPHLSHLFHTIPHIQSTLHPSISTHTHTNTNNNYTTPRWPGLGCCGGVVKCRISKWKGTKYKGNAQGPSLWSRAFERESRLTVPHVCYSAHAPRTDGTTIARRRRPTRFAVTPNSRAPTVHVV
jgi:hypothetical protein